MNSVSSPTLEFVVPIYNVEEWLADCLDSLVAQSHTEWRALLVLDGGTDSSPEIARAYAETDPRFTVLEFENGGLGAARNRGLDAARADYVMFVDSDDVLPQHAASALLELAARDGSDIVTGRATQTVDFRSYWDYWTMGGRASGLDHSVTLRAEPSLILDHTAWNKLYRREFLVSNGIRYPEGTTCEDVVPSLRAFTAADRISITDETVYVHRRRPGSITTSGHHSARAISDWSVQTTQAIDLVRAFGSPEVSGIHRYRLLRNELWTRAVRWVSLEPDLADAVRGVCVHLAGSDESFADLPYHHAAVYRLMLADERQLAGYLFPVTGEYAPAGSEELIRMESILGPDLYARVRPTILREYAVRPYLEGMAGPVGREVGRILKSADPFDVLRAHPAGIAVRDAADAGLPASAIVLGPENVPRISELHRSLDGEIEVRFAADPRLLGLEPVVIDAAGSTHPLEAVEGHAVYRFLLRGVGDRFALGCRRHVFGYESIVAAQLMNGGRVTVDRLSRHGLSVSGPVFESADRGRIVGRAIRKIARSANLPVGR